MKKYVIMPEYLFPVFGGRVVKKLLRGEDEERSVFEGNLVFGTASYLGGDIFITAAHVLKSALELGQMAVGFTSGVGIRVNCFSEYDLKEDFDIGFFRAKPENPKKFNWTFNELASLADVKAIGYPFATDNENFTINIRGFKGHVVSTGPHFRLKAKPMIYELSFAVPKGLSGAPIIDEETKEICGIVIENNETKIMVYNSGEVIKSNGNVEIVERYNSMNLGIGVQSVSLRKLKSNLFDGTFEEYVNSQRIEEEN